MITYRLIRSYGFFFNFSRISSNLRKREILMTRDILTSEMSTNWNFSNLKTYRGNAKVIPIISSNLRKCEISKPSDTFNAEISMNLNRVHSQKRIK